MNDKTTKPQSQESVSFQAHPCDIEGIEAIQLHLNQIYADNGVVRNCTRSEAVRLAIRKYSMQLKDTAQG